MVRPHHGEPQKKDRKLGYDGYEEVLPKLRAELDRLIAKHTASPN
jgi:hypothetical protein